MRLVKEGEAKVFVPEESLTKKSETFYNPEMEHQRNITISLLKLYSKNKNNLVVLDPLAASGVRGIRILKEVPGIGKVVLNDLNPKAVELMQRNLKLNKIPKSKTKIHKRDANILMLENRKTYDFVDIDPFGSPIRYLKNVGNCLKLDSLFGVTATDSGALAGSFPKACSRRYGIKTAKTDFPKELGIRVLITSILQNLAPYELTFEPLYSHGNHYFRAIGLVNNKNVDKNLSEIKIISYCPECHSKKTDICQICENCGNKTASLGPLWTGKIQNREFCNRLLGIFDFKNKREILGCSREIDEPFYYDLHKLCKSLKTNPPKIDKVIEKLKQKGFEASRTHLCRTGVKTNASVKEILESMFS